MISAVQTRSSRSDLQGLRAIAVVLVVALHVFGVPAGGFLGVDVFFVLSGYLITKSLLDHTRDDRPDLARFWRHRVRRIVPMAVVVLAASLMAGYFILESASLETLTIDAAFAFFFVSNWRFALTETDYFTATAPPSPVQHYWSLSVEEQFYAVWPLLLLAVALVAVRTGRKIPVLIPAVLVTAASFGYAVYAFGTDPTWAYFSTFARVWELGIGAGLAALPALALSARWSTPAAWTGLVLIALGVWSVDVLDGARLLPMALAVAGTAAIVTARTESVVVLSNPVSRYLGDISYSIYLWHFPVIVFAGFVVPRNGPMQIGVCLLTLGLSIASYHLLEDPVRSSRWLEPRNGNRTPVPWSMRPAIAGLAVLAVSLGVLGYANHTRPSPDLANAAAVAAVSSGPRETALSAEIDAAVARPDWPALSPTIDDAMHGPQAREAILTCASLPSPDPSECTWGPADARHRIAIVGDSAAQSYAKIFKNLAEAPGSDVRFRSVVSHGCPFSSHNVVGINAAMTAYCPIQRDRNLASIRDFRPTLLVIVNAYRGYWSADTNGPLTREDRADGVDAMIAQVRDIADEIVILAPPPISVKIGECYSKLAKPADCMAPPIPAWTKIAAVEQGLADENHLPFVDSTRWFCSGNGLCPSFVGTTPVHQDDLHITPEYTDLIGPAVLERFRALGLVSE